MDLQIKANKEAAEYLYEIAKEMTSLFQISQEEAIGRINKHFGSREFITSTEVNALVHEEQDIWAKHIYYGKDSFWWVHKGELSDLKPVEYP